MWEVFKISLLCLISVVLTSVIASWLFTCVLFAIITFIIYDFDFSTVLEQHAISKIKHLYLKVRNLYNVISHNEQFSNSFLYSPIMNSVNKQSSFELSRFNKSGNPLSPITNSASGSAVTSRRLIQARSTSTPLTKTSPWQKNGIASSNTRSQSFQVSLSNHSPRYSLSTLSPPKPENHESPSRPTIQTVTGPLLASTRFNINLGTYTDVKSPGLASRVVQYHNELSGEQTSTHQTKYGSPGQFPIVQLYKKELPILSRIPRRCTVRIAPPDPVSYNSEQANAILRESFVQQPTDRNNQMAGDTEINTRSVLEALKEISRKRIHAGDDLEDISKRQRTNSLSGGDHMYKDGKRMREDTPPKPKDQTSVVITSAPKRICVVNEIESSLSSSRLMRLQQQQGQKRKGSSNVQENNKQRKLGTLVSRETQTVVNDNNKPTEPPQNPISKTSTVAQTQTDKPINHSTSDDIHKLMEESRNKKHRHRGTIERTLSEIDEENSTLNYNRAGSGYGQPIFDERPLEIIKQNKLAMMLSAFSGEVPTIIPLPTITLSSLKKQAQEAEALDAELGKNIIGILSPKNKAKHDKHVTFSIPENGEPINYQSTENSTADSANTSPFNNFAAQQTHITSTSTQEHINFNLGSTVTANSANIAAPSSSSPSIISFGPVTTTTVATSIISSTSVYNAEKTSTPTISFGAPNTSFGSPKTPTFSGLDSQGQGGFATPINNVPAANTSFNTPTTTIAKPTLNTNLFGGISNSIPTTSAPAFSFGAPKTTPPASVPPTSSTITFGTPQTTTASAFSNLPSQLFNFPSAPKPATTTSQTTVPKMGGFQFDLGKTAPTPLPSPTGGVTAPANTLGSTTKSGAFPFGGSNSASTGFGITNSNPPSFGTTVAAVTNVPSKPSIVFGTGTASTTPSTTTSNIFGTISTASSTMFGTPNAAQINTNNSTQFGVSNSTNTTPSVRAFGSTGTSAFGTPNATNTNGVFGGNTSNTNTSGFAPPSTGTNSNMPGLFGAPSTNTNAATPSGISFGTPNPTAPTPAFGVPSTTALPAFGVPSITTPTPAFGVPSTTAPAPAFGAPSTTTPTPAFGASSTTTPTPAFGAPSTTTPTPAFGAPSTTAPPPAFGVPSTTTPTPAFGAASTTHTPGSVFGAPNSNATTSMFGGANSAFGAPKTETSSATPPSFGGFGNRFNSTPTTTQNNPTFGSRFGITATTTQSSTFGSTATTTNNFNFGGSTGATKTFSFGSTTPATTTVGTTMFGSSAPATNLFAGGHFGGGNTPATTTTQSSFGQASGVFGAASTSATFGNGASSSVFGGANGNNNTSSGFVSTGGVFGAASPPSGSAFGAPTTAAARNVYEGQNNYSAIAAQPAGGMFGGAVTTNTSNTSFGGAGFNGSATTNTQNPPSFGAFGSPAVTQTQTAQPSSGVFSFGGAAPAAPPAVAGSTNNAFQFGTAPQTPKTGGFNFSGSTATPNISFGGGAAPSYSSPPAPAFGAPQGQFGAPAAPATGMFNIGSGSTAPKQRHMIKARRRN